MRTSGAIDTRSILRASTFSLSPGIYCFRNELIFHFYIPAGGRNCFWVRNVRTSSNVSSSRGTKDHALEVQFVKIKFTRNQFQATIVISCKSQVTITELCKSKSYGSLNHDQSSQFSLTQAETFSKNFTESSHSSRDARLTQTAFPTREWSNHSTLVKLAIYGIR